MKRLLFLFICSFTLLFARSEHTAKVLEILNSGPYSYLKVEEKGKNYWIAITAIPIQKGSTISFTEGMKIEQFESKSLHRSFKNLIFADSVRFKEDRRSSKIEPLSKKLLHAKVSPYKKEGTLSVEEVFTNAGKLKGKKIKVRGKVIKVAREIMKRDWVHIEDGTGEEGSDDLVFTTDKADLKKGDIVTAEGSVAIEKDFGYGYFYPVIVEKSSFHKE